MKSSTSGTRGLIELGGGGTRFMIWNMTEVTSSPVNGGRPVSISWRITPSEKMSERGSARLPATCSGDM